MKNIVQQFLTANETGQICPLKIGHINDSFIVESKEKNGESYFLQRINHQIFQNVAGLQDNIRLVTDHLCEKLTAAGKSDIERKVLMQPLKEK